VKVKHAISYELNPIDLTRKSYELDILLLKRLTTTSYVIIYQIFASGHYDTGISKIFSKHDNVLDVDKPIYTARCEHNLMKMG